MNNLDVKIFSAPAVLGGALNAGAVTLESKNSRFKPLTITGVIVTQVIASILEIPLIVYTVAKALFANILFYLTFAQVEALAKFKDRSLEQIAELRLKLAGFNAILLTNQKGEFADVVDVIFKIFEYKKA